MKPCKICTLPKGHHDLNGMWYRSMSNYSWDPVFKDIETHKFEMDNLVYLERKLKVKELEEKHRKLNFCLVCKNNRKSPFGICKECSERLIEEKKNESFVRNFNTPTL